MKLPDFESPSSDSLSKSANFGLSKWIIYVKNHPNLSKKKYIEEYQFKTIFFCKIHFFDKFHFKIILLLKWHLIFVDTVLSQHYRYQKNICNVWFLCKSEACVKCGRHKRHNPNLVTHRKEGVVPLAPGGPPDRWPTCPPHLHTCLPSTCPGIRRPACLPTFSCKRPTAIYTDCHTAQWTWNSLATFQANMRLNGFWRSFLKISDDRFNFV